jgi:XTP/dITP diphosphohydrolase
VFVPAGLAVTSAELDPAEKNVRSHRAQALRALVAKLQKE